MEIIAAIFLLGICIFFHELGHFLMGKLMKIKPKIFSIGYGKGIWYRKVGDTIYQITAIPLGGYVEFYGDDPTKEHPNPKPGDFFAAGPWRRILVAFGGPLFSILLGFLVLFFVMLLGWQPMTNIIEVEKPDSMAAKLGLKSKDRILAVNGKETPSFDRVGYAIALAESPRFIFTIERDGKIMDLEVVVPQKEEGGIRAIGGMRPMGRAYLQVTQNRQYPNGVILLQGDKIIQVDEQKVSTVKSLVTYLNEKAHEKVKLFLLRKGNDFFFPAQEKELVVEIPLQRVENLLLRQMVDVQTQMPLADREILANQKELYSRIQLGDESFDQWDALKKALMPFQGKRARLRLGAVEVEAQVSLGVRKMLGLTLAEGVDAEKAQLGQDFFSLVERSINELVTVIHGTVVGLYRILQGKLSFNKSISGPVKIMAVAAKSVSHGWETYWFLLAQITIILGIMNLLPLPVLDGGHIVFYLIEALYKPLPAKAIALSYRLGFAFFIALGVYVIALDIYDVFIRGWL
ncbi:MAG: RIP metalloprotease RseP [Leptospiraceae bacterium]|nr:RIP metalloprotease RseP [Leptospiraceae bacterium]MDW8306248.1 RIP metalloprotease RseP [Leptospiraceae bacterium]